MLYLQLSNSKDKVFLRLLLKINDYFVKKLMWFKCVTYFNLENI